MSIVNYHLANQAIHRRKGTEKNMTDKFFFAIIFFYKKFLKKILRQSEKNSYFCKAK
jgi:hypothetical protein